ncbi:helix-turn-helix domain-containing protein [Gluconacetobacter takamatsuzukensis]|uniref:Helix-turn-helix domain-containing protein n=1 Tax=Gluconacetobacter takamatsuzukensis TaxID=1286190 RepID=A0A7W4KB73_9PROT|nr:helix-turn-helix domain-containing protein [Gluconacetobacter takamatsuzukensis]MBB2203748.1 helix-turn-helix domain-containing protein [Gluconacetobacter takamatsuzukensis]
MDVTHDQIRAARALLNLPQQELARRAHVSVITIRRLESPGTCSRVSSLATNTVRQTLEQAGVEFIPDGVRRRQPPQQKAALLSRLQAISRASAARLQGNPPLTDDDLYDDHGLPA